MKKVPVYISIVVIVLWTTILVGCRWIPTDYTTSKEQQNLTRQNTLIQIELLRRYDKMDPARRFEFMIENVKYAIAMEEIICGEVKDANKLFETVIQDKKKLEEIRKKIEDSKKPKTDDKSDTQ